MEKNRYPLPWRGGDCNPVKRSRKRKHTFGFWPARVADFVDTVGEPTQHLCSNSFSLPPSLLEAGQAKSHFHSLPSSQGWPCENRWSLTLRGKSAILQGFQEGYDEEMFQESFWFPRKMKRCCSESMPRAWCLQKEGNASRRSNHLATTKEAKRITEQQP